MLSGMSGRPPVRVLARYVDPHGVPSSGVVVFRPVEPPGAAAPIHVLVAAGDLDVLLEPWLYDVEERLPGGCRFRVAVRQDAPQDPDGRPTAALVDLVLVPGERRAGGDRRRHSDAV